MHRATTAALRLGAALAALAALAVIGRLAVAAAAPGISVVAIYVVLPLLIALTCALLSTRPLEVQLSALITMVALVMVVLAFELRLATNDPLQVARDRVARAARAAGRTADARSALQVVSALRAHGDPAYPAMYGSAIASGRLGAMPVTFAAGPETTLVLANVPDRTTVYCNEGGTYSTYHTDSLGFENENAWWDRGALDAVVVGDSYAAGACVPPDSNLTAALRHEGLRTVNLGIGGSGPLAELARLREFAAPLAPRLVLWVFTEANDFDDLRAELTNPLLRRYLDGAYTQRLAMRHAHVESVYVARFDSALADGGRGLGLTRTRSQRLRSVTLRQVLSFQDLRTALTLPPIVPRTADACCDERTYDVAMLRSILAEADREVTAWGGRLVFVDIPDNAHLIEPDGRFCRPCATSPRLDSLLAVRHRAIETARSLSIPIVDLHERLIGHEDPRALFPFPGGHFSGAGYAFVAGSIVDELRRDALVPLPPSTTRP